MTSSCSKINETFRCVTSGCVNVSVICDGVDNCLDGSDESFTHAHCYDIYKGRHEMALVEIVAIVVGCIVAVAVMCCILGTVLECAAHVYKYWCPTCVHRLCGGSDGSREPTGYQPTSHVTSGLAEFPTGYCDVGRSSEPIVLFVKAIPPNYTTVSLHSDIPSNLSLTPSHGPPGQLGPADDEVSLHEFNHAAVYGRQFYQGARGRQFYHSSRTRRHSNHVIRTGYNRPISSRGFDHVILPNRGFHPSSVAAATSGSGSSSRDPEPASTFRGGGECTCDLNCMQNFPMMGSDVSQARRAGEAIPFPVSECSYSIVNGDLDRVLISGEYVAYRLIRTRPEMTENCHRYLCSQSSMDFMSRTTSSQIYECPSSQPDIVTDIAGPSPAGGGGCYVTSSQPAVATAPFDDRNLLPAMRSPNLVLANPGVHICSHNGYGIVKPPPSYASVIRN